VDTFVQMPTTPVSESKDGVQMYAMEVVTLGLLWHAFHDSIQGDGERILRCWKFLYVIFKSTNHTNYAKESINILYQYHYVLSERQQSQFFWSRCVNTRGGKGKNITCDLYMEHLNKRLKKILRGMGSSISPKRIEGAGQSIQAFQRVCETFEKQKLS